MTESLRLVVVTGLSGSGKSTAIHVLEDLGFYCIDNLPIALIPRLVELWETSRDEVRRVALGIDVRARHFLAEFPRVFDELRAQEVALEVLYLEASDDVLVRRFSETRRPHPADQGGGIADGIRREREKLHGLRELADRILDTSAFTVHEFRSALRDLVDRPEPGTMTPTWRSTAAFSPTPSSSRGCGTRRGVTRRSRTTCSAGTRRRSS